MKKFIIPICCVCILLITLYYINPISDLIISYLDNNEEVVIKESNEYTKYKDYLYVQRSTDFIPYSYQDLLNIYYTVVDNGWDTFTFYCPEEYSECVNDITKISKTDETLTHLNNYVHPFNSFTRIKSMIDNNEITLSVTYLYTSEEINAIDEKTDEILNSLALDNLDDYDKIKTVHDYIINNAKYDIEKNENNTSEYSSATAYGPLFEGYATCNGYTDLMAIYLTKMGYDNIKVATTEDEISYSSAGHIWNAVKLDDTWFHLDLTWDDPVSNDNKDYLFHTYFLVTTKEMKEADAGQTVVEEHNFNYLYYLELKETTEE